MQITPAQDNPTVDRFSEDIDLKESLEHLALINEEIRLYLPERHYSEYTPTRLMLVLPYFTIKTLPKLWKQIQPSLREGLSKLIYATLITEDSTRITAVAENLEELTKLTIINKRSVPESNVFNLVVNKLLYPNVYNSQHREKNNYGCLRIEDTIYVTENCFLSTKSTVLLSDVTSYEETLALAKTAPTKHRYRYIVILDNETVLTTDSTKRFTHYVKQGRVTAYLEGDVPIKKSKQTLTQQFDLDIVNL